MCAIAGFVDLKADETAVVKMHQTMERRGPDGSGIYSDSYCTLLHTRLAIIDPAGGKQPMQYDNGTECYVISYNGELYNTQELRGTLEGMGHVFCGYSDTEVVLHAYAQWGPSALEHLNGIFAFAILETKSKRVFLARDRIGVKPLFLKRHEQGLIFASEIKTILAYPSVHAELDRYGVAEIILLGPGRTPGCGVFRGIEELKPGHFACYSDGRLDIHRYWYMRDREHRESFDETVEYVRWLVTDSIKRQMVSDVPIGTFLSGGLDSSIISSICAQEKQSQGVPLETFSVDYMDNEKYFQPSKFQPNSDTEYINIMQSHIVSNHHWSVLTPDDLVNALEDATRARDLPGMADVDFSLLAFCKDIRSNVKVALSGECADEIFGGYPWYRDPEIRSAEGFPWAQNTMYRANFLHKSYIDKINAEEYVMDRYKQTLHECDILENIDPTERRVKEMVNLNFQWFMQTLLDRKDRMSMYHGLEVRVPFCDYRIAEYLYGVPWQYKEHLGMEKGLLRKAVEGLLPDQIRNRKKSPYPKTYNPLYMHIVSEKLKALLSDREAPIFQIINAEALERLLTEEQKWPWYGQLMKTPQTIAYMLQIDFWLREYNITVV